MVIVQKRLKGASVKADFWHGEYIEYADIKKAQNSDFHWGPLHGEIGLLKKQTLFYKYLCTSYLCQILVSFRRVQLIPFSFLSCLANVSI